MEKIPFDYEINQDIQDQHSAHLRVYLIATSIVAYGGMLSSLVINTTSETSDANSKGFQLSIALLLVSMAGGAINKKNNEVASWFYTIGLIGVIALGIVLTENFPQLYFLMVIPILLSMTLLHRDGGIVITIIAVITMIVLGMRLATFSAMIGIVSLPALLCVIISAVSYLMADNYQQFVYWAIDSQKKNQRRADIFYEQREQLKDALHRLTKANDKLERMNVQLEEAQHHAEEASKAKSVFLSNMSHELRTPLNTVIGYTSSMLNFPEMYESKTLPSVYKNDIELILANGQYLLGLINDILDLSKIEAGKLDLIPAAVDLIDIFKGVSSTATGLLRDKPLQFRRDYPDTLPHVWADSLRIRQVLLNLVSNAIKFTATGSITLTAKVVENQVVIAVTDTGIGIEEAAIERIFERFEQAKHDTDRKYGGTGLGLDISQRLVKMHGGEIKITSKVGFGSTFSFSLPMATPQQIAENLSPDQQMAEQGMTIFEPDALDLTAMPTLLQTILLIEDDSNTRQLFRRVLEGADYIVVDTHDGGLVMELATGLLPDLIILDIHLPNTDGWQILEALRDDEETAIIPTLVLTVDTDRARAESLGAVGFLQKPVESDVLLRHVKQIISNAVVQQP